MFYYYYFSLYEITLSQTIFSLLSNKIVETLQE
jgi:hypothetical protein